MSQRSFTTRSLFTTMLGASLLLPGCMLEKRDDGAEFREAVPQREAVVVAGPEDGGGGDRSTASIGEIRGTQASGPASRPDYSKWYAFTRVVRDGVNTVTGAVLGSVWLVVHSEPTSVEEGEAVWGPYSDALEPATYRFRVRRMAEAEYDYVLEGRPKTSTSDGDYRAVLEGHGYGKRHELHGEGEFTIDLDAARALDPFQHRDDSGSVRVVHHLPGDISEHLDALPRTIIAEVTPDPAVNPESYSVTSTANEDGTGTLQVVAKADVDDTKTTQLEDIAVDSRWRGDGAGRADILISGGDIPAQLAAVGAGAPTDNETVSAVECWGADFARSYYADSIGIEPTEGDALACVYEAP
ncbi:MAG TPA: hypothetical protein VIW29_02680 [Polyangiaceae bacterium]